MKFSLLTLTAVAGLVAAQDLSAIPQCALQCLAQALPQTGCSVTDSACQCKPETQAQLTRLAGPCLIQSCDAADLVAAQSAGAAACRNLAASGAAPSAEVTSSAPAVQTSEPAVDIQTSEPTEAGFTIQTSTPTEAGVTIQTSTTASSPAVTTSLQTSSTVSSPIFNTTSSGQAGTPVPEPAAAGAGPAVGAAAAILAALLAL